jgi:hypothetical protein
VHKEIKDLVAMKVVLLELLDLKELQAFKVLQVHKEIKDLPVM